jgi:hypothetical protein
LSYYCDEQSTRELGTLFVGGCKVWPVVGGKRPFSFCIQQATVDKDYYIACASKEECDEWMGAVASASSLY